VNKKKQKNFDNLLGGGLGERNFSTMMLIHDTTCLLWIQPARHIDDDEAETAALAAAVAHAQADPRTVPREDVRNWLLQLAAGDFTAKAPPNLKTLLLDGPKFDDFSIDRSDDTGRILEL